MNLAMEATSQENKKSESLIQITDSAREKILLLMKRERNSDAEALRVSIVGGGCSGYSYKMGFEKSPQPQDHEFVENQIRVYVDPKSALFLKGIRIDYVDGLNGSGFTYENPNATKSCGCGTSFGV